MNNQPSVRYQLWPQILLLTLAIWIASSVLVIRYTWSFGDLELGPISGHFIYLWDHSWKQYMREIIDARIHFHIIARFGLPCFLLLAASFCFSLKLLWKRGGRELAHHVSGPILLEGKQAIRHARYMSRKGF